MAIEYSFSIDTPRTSDEIEGWLGTRLGMSQEGNDRVTCWVIEGMACFVLPTSALGQELKQECFGILPRVEITCRIDKFEKYEAGMNNLMELCVAIIQSFPGDFVLLSNGESGLLYRKDGVLTAKGEEDYWCQRWQPYLADRGIPYEAGHVPSM